MSFASGMGALHSTLTALVETGGQVIAQRTVYGGTFHLLDGILPGYVSDFIRFPDDSITIVLFSNLDRSRLDRIARDVSACALGLSYDPPVSGTVVPLRGEQVAALEGDFKMADGELLTIRNAPDYLTAKLTDSYTAGLIPLSPVEFYFPLGDGRALFTLDARGKAVRVNMRYGGEDHVAERVPDGDGSK
jgi:hypothetical protein